jgi:beta-aspartyl-peptidase (threonine type)
MGAAVLTNGEGGVGIQRAVDTLANNGSALDAVEAGIRVVELNPSVRSVGFGGAPNVLGEMECDAAIMCGATLCTGAVGALKNYFHAISVARKVIERTPHVMLVGEGAAIFAAEIGEKKGNLLSDEARADYEQWLKDHVPPDVLTRWPDVPLVPIVWPSAEPSHSLGTTIFLVRTNNGNLAGGVSTSGWAYKYPGRLGDSPIIGAGLYVDNRYGAVACTHTGEMTIRAGTSRVVIAYMKKGATLPEACHEALDDLRALKGGYLGPVVVHAMDAAGTPCVVGMGLDKSHYWFWGEGVTGIERRNAVIEKI